jgi:hypothetical protein
MSEPTPADQLAQIIATAIKADPTEPYVWAEYLDDAVIDGRVNLLALAEVILAKGYQPVKESVAVLEAEAAEYEKQFGPTNRTAAVLSHAAQLIRKPQ